MQVLSISTKRRVIKILLVGFIFIAVILAYNLIVNRKTNIKFSELTNLTYSDAQKEIRENSNSSVIAKFDNRLVEAVATGIAPGKGVGMNPRFVNIGNTPGAVYRGPEGEWYLLGKFKLLDYKQGQWVDKGEVYNERYTYKP
ncbi:MAG: hypothetical protein ACYC27_02385 [Armatimonadota bacterium]